MNLLSAISIIYMCQFSLYVDNHATVSRTEVAPFGREAVTDYRVVERFAGQGRPWDAKIMLEFCRFPPSRLIGIDATFSASANRQG